MDFTIAGNKQIRNYFEGSDSYIPSSELVYLHEHPLIKDSFLRELEVLINKSALCITKHNVRGSVLNQYIEVTKNLGALLNNVNQDNAPNVMNELRKVYSLSTKLLNQFNFK